MYCSRSCSSKAYRRRRAHGQQAAVADALIASRTDTPDGTPTPADAQRLLDLAAALQRAVARYLQNLQDAHRPDSPDPHGTRALELLHLSITSTTQHLLRTAHDLRHQTLTDHPTRPTTPTPTAAEAPRVESGPARPPADPPAPPRDEPDPRATATPTGPGPVPPRVETPAPAPAQRRPLRHGPTPAVPLPSPDTARPLDPTPDTAADPAALRLALDAERTSHPPTARGLGAPTGTWSAGDGDNALLVDGWDHDPSVLLARRPDGGTAGWVAALGDAWGTYIDGRLVTDAADGRPWLSPDARYALALLRMALDQHLA
ncbi:hypothetical protein [Kitasatospora sp. NPDC059571]|uniref:hypothetical protein n=1 Tax=Kitasatospora sp. NPDC059571 TaxID=3346871 RepID=UPI0036CFE8DB